MKLSEIYEIADKIAPKSLSDEYCKAFGAYDNSGLLIEAGEEIEGILFSLDLTNTAVDEAIKKDCNLIITHHPVIFGKIDHVCLSDEKLLGAKLVKCLKNGISVLSMHLNLDVAEGGIDESLMEGVLLASGKTAGAGMRSDTEIMHPVQASGYGRVYDIQPTTLEKLKENIEEIFSSKRVLVYGEKDRKITRAASFCGAGGDEEGVLFAKKKGADVILSADFKHHVITFALESGLSVIALTHYASENYGFKKYYEKICQQVNVPCVWHVDEMLL